MQWDGGWIAEAVLVHDLEGQILDANERAAEMLGYSVAELRARDMFSVEESLRETGLAASRENWRIVHGIAVVRPTLRATEFD